MSVARSRARQFCQAVSDEAGFRIGRSVEIDLAARTRGVQILRRGSPWCPSAITRSNCWAAYWWDGKPVSEWAFPARNRRGHLGTSAMLDLLERLGWGDRTPPTASGLPSRPWATARTNYAREVVELCLSHV